MRCFFAGASFLRRRALFFRSRSSRAGGWLYSRYKKRAMRAFLVGIIVVMFATLVLGTGGIGCGSSTRTNGDASAVLCSVEAPTACPDPSPHYADIAPIINQRCAEPCHSGVPEGPWPLTDYPHVADWADVVRTDLILCLMPPADGGVSMSDDERLAILTWIRCGFPE